MSRVNNKWINREAWTFHITNKNLLKQIISSGKDKDLEQLTGLQIDDKWLINEGEGDPPNMDWIRRMDEAWRKEFEGEIPIWLSFGEKKVIALFRQDSAYSERIGGIINWIIFNEKYWRSCQTKKDRVKFIEDIRDWWNEADRRERSREWILTMWNRLIKWYQKKPFWEKTINFLIEYTLEHKDEWQPNQIYDPKTWFPRGRGQMNDLVHGGIA